MALVAVGDVAALVSAAETTAACLPPAVEPGTGLEVEVEAGALLDLVLVDVAVVDVADPVLPTWVAVFALAVLRRAALLTTVLGLDSVLVEVLVRLADAVVVVGCADADELAATVVLLVPTLALVLTVAALFTVFGDAVVVSAGDVEFVDVSLVVARPVVVLELVELVV